MKPKPPFSKRGRPISVELDTVRLLSRCGLRRTRGSRQAELIDTLGAGQRPHLRSTPSFKENPQRCNRSHS